MSTAIPSPQPRSAGVGRWVLLLHVVLSPLLFCTRTADVFEGPKAALLAGVTLALMGLAASAWVARGAPFRLPARPDLTTLGFLLFVGSAAVSTVFSISPLVSWRGAADSHAGLQTLLGYLILYLSTRALCRTAEDGRRLLAGAVVAAALSSVYAIIQAVRLDPAAWTDISAFMDRARPFGMFGHANYLAAYLVMTGPLIALFLLRAVLRRRWGAAVTLALVALLAGAAVVASLSRAAWLAGGAAVVVLGVGWFAAGCRRSAFVLAGLACAAVVAGAVCWAVADASGGGLASGVGERLGRVGDGAGRWQIWRAAADLFRDRPLTGWGTDTFQIAFGKHRPADYADAEWDVTPTRAHNVVLHVLATQGLLGGAAAAVLAAGLGLAVVRAWRRSAPADRPTVVAVAAALTAFVAQDVFGFTVVGCGSLFVVAAGLLSRWGVAAAEGEPGRRNSAGAVAGLLAGGGAAVVLFLVNIGWSGFAAAAALAVAAVGTALALRPTAEAAKMGPRPAAVRRSPWAPALHAAIGLATAAALYFVVVRPLEADVARGDGDRLASAAPADALASYERAAAIDPDDDRGWTRLSAAAQLAARQATTPEEQRRLFHEARDALDRALALVPIAPYHHASLGRFLGETAASGLGPADDALAEWDAALADDPLNAAFLAEAARTALAVGRRDRAPLDRPRPGTLPEEWSIPVSERRLRPGRRPAGRGRRRPRGRLPRRVARRRGRLHAGAGDRRRGTARVAAVRVRPAAGGRGRAAGRRLCDGLPPAGAGAAGAGPPRGGARPVPPAAAPGPGQRRGRGPPCRPCHRIHNH